MKDKLLKVWKNRRYAVNAAFWAALIVGYLAAH